MQYSTNPTTEKASSQPLLTDSEGKAMTTPSDTPCPRCGAMQGTSVMDSRWMMQGRARKRVCLCCGYFFETFESFPKYEGPAYPKHDDYHQTHVKKRN